MKTHTWTLPSYFSPSLQCQLTTASQQYKSNSTRFIKNLAFLKGKSSSGPSPFSSSTHSCLFFSTYLHMMMSTSSPYNWRPLYNWNKIHLEIHFQTYKGQKDDWENQHGFMKGKSCLTNLTASTMRQLAQMLDVVLAKLLTPALMDIFMDKLREVQAR